MSATPSEVTNLVNQEPVGAGEAPALEDESQLFADLADHDEMVDAEQDAVTTEPVEGAVSGKTDAAPPSPEPVPAAVIPPAPAIAQPPAPPPVTTEAAPSTTEQPPAASVVAPETPLAPAKTEPVDFEKHRSETLPRLQELYQLSAEEAEEARLEPDKVLPKLAARLHFEVTTAVFNSVMSSLPQFVTQTLKHREAETEAENAFFGKWPDLKDPKHEATVINSIKAYRSANPRAPMSEVIDRAGLMAMLSLGLSPQQLMPQAPPVPEAPQVMRPVAPLGAGAAPSISPSAARTVEQSIFAELAEAEARGELD